MALTTVREHKMRSFLTVLGVIIGTGAVIGVGSIIAGLDGAITNILKSFGPNTIVVLRGSAMGGWTLEEQKRKTVDARGRPGHRGALPVGGTRQSLPVFQLGPGPQSPL